jgi:Zn-dependent peptidase ImmA (M78 family)
MTNVEDISRDEVVAVIDAEVDALLDAAGITAPPVDAIVLARNHLGMIVCLDEEQQQRGRAQRTRGQRHIFLRPEPTAERHQWTVAHEIGEHMKVQLLERLRLAPEEMRAMSGESLANLFAYHLLVPTRWFHDEAPAREYDLLELKRRYATASHEVIAWRFLDLPAPCIITIIDNDRIHRRRSNAWRIKRVLNPVEEKCRQYVHDHSEPCTLREAGWTVQGWPVHQLGWKREILRSVMEEWDA